MKFDKAKKIIEAINEELYDPTDWEDEFIESILNRGNDLTEKQDAVLQKIYGKAISREQGKTYR